AVGSIEDIKKRLLRRLRERFNGLAIDRNVDQHGSAWNIHVPYTMVHQLVMPFAGPGLEIDSNNTFSEQSVAGTMAAVVIAGGQLDGKVGHSKFFVDADLAPDAGIACVSSRVVFPRFGPVFVGQRDGMENPEALSGPDIESPDVPLHILLAHRNAAGLMRRADDDGVARDDRSGVESDVGARQLN